MSLWSTSSDSDETRKRFARKAALRRRHQAMPRLGIAGGSRPTSELSLGAAVGDLPDPAGTKAPRTLLVEATTPAGAIADWWHGDWWLRAATAWGKSRLRLVVLPTPGALLHADVLERLARLAIAARSWVLGGRSDGTGLASTAAIDELLRSAYHEMEFVLAADALSTRGRGHDGVLAQRGLAVMKDIIELRDARGLQRPKVVWLWQPTPTADDAEHRTAARELARQLRVDRFVLPE
ncbi:MAG: hypothetical protein JXA69_01635 [Phycisphaerae bacterium]|nr:hypothetical protein [Phycisphaerae bacterium]